MDERQYEAIKRLLDVCWQIHRANVQGGDIAAGQWLNQDFEQAVLGATQVFGGWSRVPRRVGLGNP